MSRMQNILDKAERDGAVLRIRPLPDQEVASVVTVSAVDAPPVETPDAPVHAPIRNASPRRLDRALVAAYSPDAVTARQ